MISSGFDERTLFISFKNEQIVFDVEQQRDRQMVPVLSMVQNIQKIAMNHSH